MKQFNLLLIILLSVLLVSCHQTATKYNWLPTECAPENYPVEIFSGVIHYGDQSTVPIPKGRVVNYGWGADGSVNVVGESMKEAPTGFDLSYISYAEKKNYKGTFKLDSRKLDSLFAEGYYDPDMENGRAEFHTLKIGMAPGGKVIVWLKGNRNKQLEVAAFQATETSAFDWKQQYPTMSVSMEEYGNQVIAKLPYNIQQQINQGNIPFSHWEEIRQRYHWKITPLTPMPATRIDIDYVNKESNSLTGQHLRTLPFSQQAISEKISVYWPNHDSTVRTDIILDPTEAKTIFQHLKVNDKAELVIKIDPNGKNVAVTLQVKEQIYPFRRIKVRPLNKA